MTAAKTLAFPPPLREGDRLDSREFLRRWSVMPDLRHAELLRGVVFLASPVSLGHARHHGRINGWLFNYAESTPGCEALPEATWMIGAAETPQPDVALRILPEYGGQSGVEGPYGSGAPEFVAEIAASSLSRDLGIKLDIYREAGVLEYLTVSLKPRKLTWRMLRDGKFRVIKPGPDGLLRSMHFPGLWLNPAAVWNPGIPILEALNQGLASPEHTEFVKALASRFREKKKR